MMYLAAAVAVVGLVSVLNLFLAFGVIRRLREHTETLTRLSGGGTEPGEVMLAAGEQVGEFEAVTADGTPISTGSLTGPVLAGFFSPTCQPCKERVPEFAAYAKSFAGPVLAVAVGRADEVTELAGQLSAIASHVVVQESDREGIALAFGVHGFPALCVVEDGRVVASGYQMEDLPALTSA
ncbi:TlpA family protein disulfide reductase [Longispora albida]|uniref:TlpA family protein disulfide reductase n=1 Tax=Longispora albida TaxID=203523 RepID=UPI00037A4322|nr:TlpA disulfide reductase family protein [Longispora albida]